MLTVSPPSLSSWDDGLNDNTSPESLEQAWLTTWRAWRQAMTAESFRRDDPHIALLHRRLSLIHALRSYHKVERALFLAKLGCGNEQFILSSELDPIGDGEYGY